jgi:hypothetical protein
MSIADAQRVIALEATVVELVERNRSLVARVAAVEGHVADFRAAAEARLIAEAASAKTVLRHIAAPEAPGRDADECPSCVRRREQAQARLRRHRVKIATANGNTLQETTHETLHANVQPAVGVAKGKTRSLI